MPSTTLSQVGIVIRQFDNCEDAARPWRGCPDHVAREGAGSECALNGNRFSASIINQKLWRAGGRLFSATRSGVIYAPAGVQINCAYNSDGGSRDSADGCKGGNFCGDPSDLWCDGRPHRPSDLASVLSKPGSGGYNEVILDVGYLDAHLPSAVDGFFYVKGQSKSAAQRARNTFLAENSRIRPADFPLIAIDPRNRERPFLSG